MWKKILLCTTSDVLPEWGQVTFMDHVSGGVERGGGCEDFGLEESCTYASVVGRERAHFLFIWLMNYASIWTSSWSSGFVDQRIRLERFRNVLSLWWLTLGGKARACSGSSSAAVWGMNAQVRGSDPEVIPDKELMIRICFMIATSHTWYWVSRLPDFVVCPDQ